MKKVISILMLIGLVTHLNAYANEADTPKPSLERRVQEAIKKYEIELIQERGIASIFGAAFSAPIATYLFLRKTRGRRGVGRSWPDEVFPAFIASYFTLFGARVGMELMDFIEEWRRNKINRVLKMRTQLSSLAMISKEQELLFIAAYRRDTPLMKLLITYQPAFPEEAGVWEALTELYFNQKSTTDRVQRLKEIIRKADTSPSDQKQALGRVE